MIHDKDIVKRERIACAPWRQLAAVVGLAAFFFCVGSLAQTATAGPRGENIAAGEVNINRHGSNTQITASDGAIIEWRDGFDIPANESVRFLQPGSWASVLNKDYSNNATMIDGLLSANGTVIVTNPLWSLYWRKCPTERWTSHRSRRQHLQRRLSLRFPEF